VHVNRLWHHHIEREPLISPSSSEVNRATFNTASWVNRAFLLALITSDDCP
jgi:hypothetical protein